MKRMTAALSVAAAVVLSAGLYAQTLNLSGKWTLDMEKTAAANPNQAGGGGRGGGRMGGGGMAPQTFTMDAKTLKIERTSQDGTVTATVYNLDGTDSKITMGGRGGAAPMEVIAKAKIEGNKVVIVTTLANGPQTTSWYMDGEWLVNERVQGENTIKTYYKKAS
jgi:hypothetical protein